MAKKTKPKPTRKTQSGHDRAGDEIRRLWGDVVVVDAEREIRIFIRPDDIANAIRKDESACVFAQACRRLYGCTKVMFFKSVAYIELPQDDGTKRVERFEMRDAMRRIVEAFDRGETVIPEAGFLLKPPRPSGRLDNERKRGAEKRRRAAARKAIHGTMSERVGNQGLGKYDSEPITIDLTVRNGMGAVHFTKKRLAELNREIAKDMTRNGVSQ